MPSEFTGQNGAQLNQSTHLTVTGCTKPKPKKKKKAKSKKHHSKKK